MSLLVTSCTMGKQPDRLLHKGPAYLRTRTNHSIFSNETPRKSAVELLAASKAQFYTTPVRDTSTLDTGGQDLAVTSGQHHRYNKRHKLKKESEPTRSKSEYDLSKLQTGSDDDNDDKVDGDENNNSNDGDETAAVVESTRRLSLGAKLTSKDEKSPASLLNEKRRLSTGSSKNPSPHFPGNFSKANVIQSHKLRVAEAKPIVERSKPIPPPKPSREKPKPTPKPRARTGAGTHQSKDVSSYYDQSSEILSDSKIATLNLQPQSEETQSSETKFKSTALISLTPPANSVRPKGFPRPLKLDCSSKTHLLETFSPDSQNIGSSRQSDFRNKHSTVESLTKRFTSLSASTTPQDSRPVTGIRSPSDQSKSTDCLFKAKPVLVKTPQSPHSSGAFRAKPVYIIDSSHTSKNSGNSGLRLSTFGEDPKLGKSRKRSTEAEHTPTTSTKREKRSGKVREHIQSCDIPPRLKSPETKPKQSLVSCKAQTNTVREPEMSIESAEQALSESEVNAIPVAGMESETPECVAEMEAVEGQGEITRRNSSRSGRMDPGDVSQSSSGSGHHYSSSSVPRSHSDISFRLLGGGANSGLTSDSSQQGGQHSRDSSIVSSHSRLSRASVGADLENFFNQMGLEMGVLELKELQVSGEAPGSNLGSLSSLGSQDAASICSTFSRSDNEWTPGGASGGNGREGAEAPSMGHHQQPQTSIVERNARIIKWLCNVRKAIKGGPGKVEASASTSTGKA